MAIALFYSNARFLTSKAQTLLLRFVVQQVKQQIHNKSKQWSLATGYDAVCLLLRRGAEIICHIQSSYKVSSLTNNFTLLPPAQIIDR